MPSSTSCSTLKADIHSAIRIAYTTIAINDATTSNAKDFRDFINESIDAEHLYFQNFHNGTTAQQRKIPFFWNNNDVGVENLSLLLAGLNAHLVFFTSAGFA